MRTTGQRTKLATPAAAFLLLTLCLWCSSEASAQWTTSNGNTTTTDKVGINAPGAPNPTSKLEVGGQADNLFQVTSTGSSATDTVANFSSGVGSILIVRGNGNIGIGTTAPANLLHVRGTGVSTVQVQAGSTYTGYLSMWEQGSLLLSNNRDPRTGNNYNAASPGTQLILGNSGDGQRGDLVFQTTSAGTTAAVTELVRFKASGNVGVGTATPAAKLDVNADSNTAVAINATGAISATGAITGATVSATYQDVAEWVPSTQKLAPGTVVVLDAGRANHVVASSSVYDTKVAGVVSAEPGIILGTGGEGRVKVATTGRVKVKVDASRGAIRVGDLLVTSGVEGLAMKSVPVDLGGTLIHRPGTIIGKALESLEGGLGEILVLLSLQ